MNTPKNVKQYGTK